LGGELLKGAEMKLTNKHIKLNWGKLLGFNQVKVAQGDPKSKSAKALIDASMPQISPLNMPIHKDSDINGTQNTKQAAIVFQLIGVAPPHIPTPPAHPLRGRVLLGLRMAYV
jgi:hypothetical protein